jgi:hypothetical protein
MAAVSELSIDEILIDDVQKDLIPLGNSNCYMHRNMLVPGSEEWSQARFSTACASEIPCLLGIDPHKSRGACLREKKNRVITQLSPTAERMCNIGKMYEPVALNLLQRCANFYLPIVDLGSLRLKDDLVFEGRPDAVTIDTESNHWVPIEVKTRAYPNPFDAVPYESIYDVPLKHWVQLQCYMILLCAPVGYLVSYSPNHGMRVFWQEFSCDLADKHILPCVRKFKNGTLKERVSSKEKKSLTDLLELLVKNCTQECYFES